MSQFATRLKALLTNRLLIIVAAMALLGGVFTAGIVWSSLDHVEQRRTYRSAVDEAARLLGENAELEKENEALKSRIARFERQLQVNEIAYDKLTQQLRQAVLLLLGLGHALLRRRPGAFEGLEEPGLRALRHASWGWGWGSGWGQLRLRRIQNGPRRA